MLSMMVCALGADTEMQLLHTLDFLTHILERAHGAVRGQPLKNMGQGTNNTLVSVVMMVASAIVLWGFDWLANALVKALLTLAG